jgi:uncharacterized protein YjiS (DUF1127 family)
MRQVHIAVQQKGKRSKPNVTERKDTITTALNAQPCRGFDADAALRLLARPIAALRRAVSKRLAYRDTVAALTALDERQREDIGLNPADPDTIARLAAHGR